MGPIYFGTSERPLFGMYHAPEERPVRRTGVVICPPVGEEYLRTHRALRQLAVRLAGDGFHVLRFDYSGTGDSAGWGRDATLEAWKDDVHQALDELQALGGVRRVSLVGARLGGSLALVTAAARPDVEDVVLWDPVVEGDAWVRDLLNRTDDDPGGVVGVGGFPFSPALRDELAGLVLAPSDDGDAEASSRSPGLGDLRRILLIVTEEDRPCRDLRARLERLNDRADFLHRPGAEGWENPGRMGAVAFMPAVVGAVAGFLQEEGT